MSAPAVAARRALSALCLAAALPLAMSACAANRTAAEMPGSAEHAATAGQATTEPPAPAQPADLPPRPSCNAEAAKPGLIGKTADAATVERARAAAGGHSVRVLKPGQAITKEYLDGRVNVYVDERNLVVDVGCG